VKKYLLDTKVVSELGKPKPYGGVLAWLREMRDAKSSSAGRPDRDDGPNSWADCRDAEWRGVCRARRACRESVPQRRLMGASLETTGTAGD
jgi:hypothetical protein